MTLRKINWHGLSSYLTKLGSQVLPLLVIRVWDGLYFDVLMGSPVSHFGSDAVDPDSVPNLHLTFGTMTTLRSCAHPMGILRGKQISPIPGERSKICVLLQSRSACGPDVKMHVQKWMGHVL